MLTERRLAVLGHPVAHSRSPAMQNAALAELGLAAEWSYEAIDVAPERFEERVLAMVEEGFVGANVTVPHKLAALALADRASPAAIQIGAANTLILDAGRIFADNTDASGLLGALGEPPRGMRALVLGAGGAARAAVWALVKEGASVAIWNRTAERARALAADFGASLADPGAVATAGYELLVNATTVGLAAGATAGGAPLDELPIDAAAIAAVPVVVDLAYGSAETELARLARAAGARVVDGLEVLVQQGAISFQLWTGMDPPIDVMRAAARG